MKLSWSVCCNNACTYEGRQPTCDVHCHSLVQNTQGVLIAGSVLHSLTASVAQLNDTALEFLLQKVLMVLALVHTYLQRNSD